MHLWLGKEVQELLHAEASLGVASLRGDYLFVMRITLDKDVLAVLVRCSSHATG